MIVTCPDCATRYLVDARALGQEGRVVRCANCGKTWHQEPAEDLPRPVEPLEPAEPVPTPRVPHRDLVPAMPSPPRRNPAWLVLGWIVFVVAVAGLGIGGVLARDAIVEMWPPAAKLYSLVGLSTEAPGAGLELREIVPAWESEDGRRILVVIGKVANPGAVARDVPPLRLTVQDGAKRDLKDWTHALPDNRLLPGGEVGFRTTLSTPPEGSAGVVVSFVGG